MHFRRIVAAAPLLMLLASSTREARAAYAPNVAVVLCKDTYDSGWPSRYAHMSSQAFVGLAGLVGTPYATITFDELLAKPVGTYSSVWFSNCSILPDAKIAPLATFLGSHLSQGGSVLLDGPIGALAPAPAGSDDFPWRGMDAVAPILNLEAYGWYEVQNGVVKTPTATHPLSSWPGWAPGQTLTQGLAEGTDFLGIVDPAQAGSHVLLEVESGGERYPYLVATQPGGGRVLGVAQYANDAGAATPFRNEAPKGFYDNLLLPRLIDATGWLLSPNEPYVGLQLSHAPMTAVVRLDGDQSDVPESTTTTLDYLVGLGRETGVTTMYAIVSSLAEDAEWEGFMPLAPEIERLGGAIGSHSHSHFYEMSEELIPAQWSTEIAASQDAIRAHFTTATFKPPVRVFINPGNTINWGDYGRFFADVRTYATHGFENSVPYTTGISGFGLAPGVAPVALIGDTLVPDVQWLYDDEWVYSPTEVTTYQKQILGYYQNRIGRGALYNQMWHDYAIANAVPTHFPTQTDKVRTLFDANREHFAKERVYAPSVHEVTTKLHLAQRTKISAQTSGAGVVTTTLDLSAFTADARAHLSGMGLRVNRSAKPIVAVTVNGVPHPAFTSDTVLLPPTTAGSMVVVATTGDPAPAAAPRLTYLSKAYSALSASSDSVHVDLVDPGLHTRFCAAMPAQHVIVGVDRYAPSGGETCGAIAYGSNVTGFDARTLIGPQGITVDASTRRFVGATSANDVVTLDVAAGAPAGVVSFRAQTPPTRVTLGGVDVKPVALGGGAYEVLVAGANAVQLTIELPAKTPTPPDPDPETETPPSSRPGASSGNPSGPSAPGATPDAGAADDGCSASPRPATPSIASLVLGAVAMLFGLRRRRR